MRKIVDCNALESGELREFLAASSANQALVTDFCVMESFNRGPGVHLSYQTLSEYPCQVRILETTPLIARLRPRSKGLASRFTDHDGTMQFPRSCKALVARESMAGTNFALKCQIAEDFIAELTPAAESMRKPMIEMMSKHSREELKALRTQKRLTHAMLDVATPDIARLTAMLFRDIPLVGRLPDFPQVLYSYPFRLSVSHYALSVYWARTGGLQSLPVEKLRNDITDCAYSAHASFFDGLITRDERMSEVYNLTIKLLREVFNLRSITARRVQL